jgi:hypothetical protein
VAPSAHAVHEEMDDTSETDESTIAAAPGRGTSPCTHDARHMARDAKHHASAHTVYHRIPYTRDVNGWKRHTPEPLRATHARPIATRTVLPVMAFKLTHTLAHIHPGPHTCLRRSRPCLQLLTSSGEKARMVANTGSSVSACRGDARMYEVWRKASRCSVAAAARSAISRAAVLAVCAQRGAS